MTEELDDKDEKDAQIRTISSLCNITDKGFAFKPWMDTLLEIFNENHNCYVIYLNDTDLIPRLYKDYFNSSLEPNISDFLHSMDSWDYKTFVSDLMHFLECLYVDICHGAKEYYLDLKMGGGAAIYFPLPTPNQIEDIVKVFGREWDVSSKIN